MKNLLRTLQFILQHPLNRHRQAEAVKNYFRWQIGSRLVSGSFAMPYVGKTRLLVRRGMTGATGNLYAGLAEFEEMAFVLHTIRSGDWFADVGANIGAYTMLAAGVCGASAVAIEPIPKTFESLMDNIHLNRLQSRVSAHNMGAGSQKSELKFSDSLDTVNHVLADGEEAPPSATLVPVDTLDHILQGIEPVMIKIDVEGFESEVIKGAQTVLRGSKLLAIIMELNGSGARYGFDEGAIYDNMMALGFETCRYDPWTRALNPIRIKKGEACNAIFVRNKSVLEKRLKDALKFSIHGVQL